MTTAERERCPVCDFPLATDEDCARARTQGHDTDLAVYEGGLCWARTDRMLLSSEVEHAGPAIDWRARALEAQARSTDGDELRRAFADYAGIGVAAGHLSGVVMAEIRRLSSAFDAASSALEDAQAGRPLRDGIGRADAYALTVDKLRKAKTRISALEKALKRECDYACQCGDDGYRMDTCPSCRRAAAILAEVSR